MILENNEEKRIEIESILKNIDYITLSQQVDSREDAMRVLDLDNINVVIMGKDFEDDGYEVAEEITTEHLEVAIIMIEDEIKEEIMHKALFSGAKDVVLRPIIPTRLMDSIYKAYEMNKNIPFEFNNFKGVKTLLIIEDDESVCEFLKKYLTRAFYSNELLIFYATDGKSGIKVAREIPQDLIVLDMVLGVGMDGMAVYKELKNDPRTNQSKFIFISGNFEFKSKKGIFFKKPINMKEFVDKIKELIELKKN